MNKQDIDSQIFNRITSKNLSDRNEGFKMIYKNYGKLLYDFISQKDYVLNEDERLDLIQESIITFWLNIKSNKFDPQPGKLMSYLSSISYNQLRLKYRELKKKSTLLGDLKSLEEVEISSFHELIGHAKDEKILILKKCIANLKEQNRDIINRFYFDGQSGIELSEHYGKNLNWVNQKLWQNRQKLKKCMSESMRKIN